MTKYPLSWPSGWKRTPAHQRYRAKFSKKGSSGWRDKLSIEQATQRVRAACEGSKLMAHHCHWPGCPIEVPPKLWGCKRHWFQIPVTLRHEIWRTYRPGQEIDKQPSTDYLAAAKAVREWIEGKE